MTTIKDAINDLFNAPQFTTEEAVDRHFGPSFRLGANHALDGGNALTLAFAHAQPRLAV
ncbi:hypothetical protein [Bordetella hinzii]|uniref:hypothetical protein n=1 Tax=Bordetella hinzii TaxID=103855 RepID=UPI0039FBE7E8